ncbi:MAG: TonB-dependent receptor [Pusillimonas sp.]|uniref:TonB-dependent receptor domain-containing protein n=1 Tax=Rhodanobacter sp. FW021-MT20 TaxID=1162282 RepID=UPI000260FCA0|nr:TonB-dependent outer membrane receptor protein [Rhodanobacter sp. 115]TAL99830.1 MAG: TonB-dependent receptor [Pusillimonas sp.]
MLRSKLAVAVVAALAFGYSSAYAGDLSSQTAANSPQDSTSAQSTSQSQAPQANNAKKLQTITVTGSLIPQTEIETSTPTVTITAQEMKARGFTTVAEALQQSSFATGTVQGAATSGSFTQGAQTLSMFGLPVGFVKYLIDGRPMGDFPGLYNGSDTFNNLSGIPMDMVDHIDILPGGQSSLYGSDAIAGVINIVLKKHVDGPSVDVRFGTHSGGGGTDRRISFSDGFSGDKFNLLIGAQFEHTSPIWGYDRSLTKNYFTQGTSAPVASRDYLVYSATKRSNAYYFLDPNNCANVASQFGGSEGVQHRPNSGTYCGSLNTPGYATVQNDDKSANLYTHFTYDVTDNFQLYGDLLYNYEEQKYFVGSGFTWWGTGIDYGAYYDPKLDDFVNLQRAFSPEDVGGYNNIMNKQYESSYMLSLGGKGTIGQSNWDYDVGFTHSDDKLLEHNFQRLDGPIDAYFRQHVLGPQQGMDPYYGAYPIFTPDYSAFYTPMSPADFRSFTGYTDTRAKTWDNMLRGQLTNASLFSLPGGDAGVAVVLEGGNQGWAYVPDPRLLDGQIWGTTDVQGAGHRSRYAVTTEFRLPLLSQLTADVSGRYDNYKVGGQNVNHGTYNLGIEYRPFDTLLLRGRYGTAFKTPTLSDEYQGLSGYYSFVADYANCARLGYDPGNVTSCPSKYSDVQYFGQQSGSTKLQPITAKVWSYGLVWAPLDQMSVSVDYLHWDINNEVNTESADQMSNTEYLCDVGTLDMSSPSCQNAFAQITRGTSTDPSLLGPIQKIYTPKVNVSNEQVNAVTASFNYAHGIGSLGKLAFRASYSDELKHTTQAYPNDPRIDVLRHPAAYPNGTDFKTKVNGSLTWIPNDQWSGTLYVNRYGRSPNYLATVYDNYSHAGTGKLPAWTLYNLSVTYNPIKSLALSFLVNNVLNKMPPIDRSYPGTSSVPYNTDNYNVYGRAMYIEAKYSFGK